MNHNTTIQSRLFKTFLVLLTMGSTAAFAQWSPISTYPSGQAYGVSSMSIDGAMYFGGGNPNFSTFFKYNPTNDNWTPKANLPVGATRGSAIRFSLDGAGYLGAGSQQGGDADNKFYKYNPSSDSWTEKASFPEAGRHSGFYTSVNGKGYVFCGIENTQAQAETWEYNTTTDSWTQKADFPPGGTYWPAGFVIDGKVYVGTGSINSYAKNHMYAYDVANDTWTQVADFPGQARIAATGFTVGLRGYLGGGSTEGFAQALTDMYMYNPDNDTWTAQPDLELPYMSTVWSTATVIGNKAVFGTGGFISGGVFGTNQMFAATIDNGTSAPSSVESLFEGENALAVYPNPANNVLNGTVQLKRASDIEVEVFALDGRRVFTNTVSANAGTTSISVSTSEMAAGMYTMRATANGAAKHVKFSVVH